jgi:hypothetical protein
VSYRHPRLRDSHVVRWRRQKRTRLATLSERALLNVFTVIWLARLFWRGWRLAR